MQVVNAPFFTQELHGHSAQMLTHLSGILNKFPRCGSRKGTLPAPPLRLLVFSAEHARRHRLKLLKHADKLRVAGVADLKRDLLDIPRAVVDQLFARAIRT